MAVLRATHQEMRKSLEVVELFRKAGVMFVPVPVTDEEHAKQLTKDLMDSLVKLEKLSEQP